MPGVQSPAQKIVPQPIDKDILGLRAQAKGCRGFNLDTKVKGADKRRMKWQPKQKLLPWSTAKEAQEDDDWSSALAKWQALAEEAGTEHSGLAKLLVQTNGASGADGRLSAMCMESLTKASKLDILSDQLGVKAASTLHQRGGRVAMFIRWCKSVGIDPFPLTTEKVYQYCFQCRIEKAPATRAVEVLKGLRLATILLELDNKMDIFKAPRIDGCIKVAYQRKRLTQKAQVLTTRAVAALEKAAVHETDPVKRMIAGNLRLALGSRNRGGDCTRICEEPVLELNPRTKKGYVDVKAHITKRSQIRLETSRMGVEMTSHSWGICEETWAEVWLATRAELKLDAKMQGFLLPSVGPGGTLRPYKMPTEELAMHLREILVEWGIPISEASLYTSHSLKSTLLSWCAKIGAPFKARRMLGYHAKGTEKSTLCYSRDAMAWPLRQLGKALYLIANGYFNPDTTRSGSWAHQDDSHASDLFNKAVEEVARIVEAQDPPRGASGDAWTKELRKEWEVFKSCGVQHPTVPPKQDKKRHLPKGSVRANQATAQAAASSSTATADELLPGLETLLDLSILHEPVAFDPRDDYIHGKGDYSAPQESPRTDPYSEEQGLTHVLGDQQTDLSPSRSRSPSGSRTKPPSPRSLVGSTVLLTGDSDTSSDADSTEHAYSENEVAFDSVLGQRISADTLDVDVPWNQGLSPEPLYSFYHTKSHTRHWSYSDKGTTFICPTARTNKHVPGGNLFMDIRAGVCRACVRKASTDDRVMWKAYMARESRVFMRSDICSF